MTQPDAREGQAGPPGESDRSIVPLKRGNSRRGKGPDFGRAMEATRAWGLTVRSRNPVDGSEVVERAVLTGEGCAVGTRVYQSVKPVGEPDAVDPHVRFDVAGGGNGAWRDTRAPATERAGNTQGLT